MSNLENLSGFGAADLLSIDREGHSLLVVCVAARFVLPRGGKPVDGELRPAEEQRPPPVADEYFGELGTSSLKYEGQTAYVRRGTDIYVLGQAYAAGGRRTNALLVEVQVGRNRKEALVVGDRVWKRSLVGATLSEPTPFVSMPLVYERAFGGEREPRNPVGRGLYENARNAADQPAPNLEDSKARIQSLTDRPRPVGFGPIARSWKPRLDYAGTYDARWVEERAPLWPLDFDERFFCAAAEGLTTARHLEGGEPVHLVGLSPHGPIDCLLPRRRIKVRAVFRDRVETQMMALDAVQLEPDEQILTLIWRTAIRAGRALRDHEVTVVRSLEPWETTES